VRVVFLNPAGQIGGAERVLLAAVRAVRDHKPAVVLLADGPLRAAAEMAGATMEVLPLPPALAGVGDTQFREGGRFTKVFALARTAFTSALPATNFLRRLRILLRRLRPDVVHSNGLKTHLLARGAVPAGVPITWHVHDFYSERPLMARLLKLAKRGVAGAVAISDAVRRDVETLLPGAPVSVVRNGVDTGHFSPADRDGAALDRLAGLTVGEFVRVGLVATYANWKGHAVFLHALARLPADVPVRGFIVGGPIYTTAGSQWTHNELVRLVEQLGLSGRVGFVPFQPDPADVYRMLDVVVHASTRPEPFGLTIAEAMSCGRAVAVSAAGGAVELFTDGVDALGHPPGDVKALADAIHRLVTDVPLRTRLGLAARETALRAFDEDRFARELVEVFRRTVSRPTMT
jgi:glycosyltransferase involved in cell wall biosynthesis